MNKLFYSLLTIAVLSTGFSFAQSPEKINYQAVALNGGTPVSNQNISVRLSILNGSSTGTLLFEETHPATTDNQGLFALIIGNGTVTAGSFNAINWGVGEKWLKTEIDITGGNNFVLLGSSQFLSVPYALYANQARISSPSYRIPDGFEDITTIVLPDSVNYTVPAGKNLYLQHTISAAVFVDNTPVHNAILFDGADNPSFLGVSEGQTVYFTRLPKIGFLVDKSVQWVSHDLYLSPYTVPAGKKLVIIFSDNYFPVPNPQPPFLQPDNCSISINGNPLNAFRSNLRNTIWNEGTVLSSANCNPGVTGTYQSFNGYLLDN